MDHEFKDGDAKPTSYDGAATHTLTQVPTSVTLSAEQFEKLYLSPLSRRQPEITKKLGNPTPLYVFPTSPRRLQRMRYLTEIPRGLGAFIITTTPLSCCLMGWRGAGGAGAAFR